MNDQAARYYEFGPFRLSLTDRLLMRDDRIVPLTPKLVDTLVLLVEHSGHVMSKNTLMEALWPDSFVEESSLTQNVSLLRRALAEFSEGQQFIETIPKRGYRFVASVTEKTGDYSANGDLLVHESTSTQFLFEEQLIPDTKQAVLDSRTAISEDSPGTQKPTRRFYRLGTAAFVLVAAVAVAYFAYTSRLADRSRSNTIAVLPFKTIGPQSEPELMGLGMADAVILRLNSLEGTTVLPTSSVFRYTTREKDSLSIARDLGVETVLDGTVQRDGDRIRVTAQLMRSSDGRTLWSETFDEPYNNIFALQDSISEKMAAAIGHRILKKPATGLSTKNLEANQAYLTGLYFWNQRTKANLAKAIEYFKQAVQKDPSFARAHAVLADSYYLCFQREYEILPKEEALRRSQASAEQALALNNTIPEAYVVKARVLVSESRLDEANREFQRALELDPDSALAHLRYGCFLFYERSNLAEALIHVNKARELDPVSPLANAEYAYMLYLSRDYDSAIRFYQRALELQPDVPNARVNLGAAYVQKQMFTEALAEFEKASLEDPKRATRNKAYLFGMWGRRAEALKSLAQFNQLENSFDPVANAVICAALGDKRTAFQWLNKTNLTPSTTSILRYDPQLDPLRNDSRFGDYLKRRETGG